jgi:FkbM family methyltransferase
MQQGATLSLPNGLACHLTSKTMVALAKYIRWEIFERKEYLRPGFELRPDDIIVDVGGNIGMFVLWAAPQVPRGRIVTVEPNPAALECLRLNVESNGLWNVEVAAVAVGAKDGEMELVYNPGFEAHAHAATVQAPWYYRGRWPARISRWTAPRAANRDSGAAFNQRIVVKQLRLAAVMEEHHLDKVDYLKIDCEGGEYAAFKGMDADHWARVERVVVEYHDFGRDRHGELVKILQDNGFEVAIIRAWQMRLVGLLGAQTGMIWAKRAGA